MCPAPPPVRESQSPARASRLQVPRVPRRIHLWLASPARMPQCSPRPCAPRQLPPSPRAPVQPRDAAAPAASPKSRGLKNSHSHSFFSLATQISNLASHSSTPPALFASIFSCRETNLLNQRSALAYSNAYEHAQDLAH